MTFKKVLIGIVAALIVVVLYFANFGYRTTRIEDLRRLTDQSVPIGASPELVTHFLDTQHLEHSELIKPEMMHLAGHDYANKNIVLPLSGVPTQRCSFAKTSNSSSCLMTTKS